MTRKVIIDCDPGIDDAIALTMALFDPSIEVIAVTAVAGNVPADQATRNVQATIEQLDPPRYPRIGNALDELGSLDIDSLHIHGRDGLGNTNFEVSRLHQRHFSDKLIGDEIRASDDPVTLVCLGPLTNAARTLRRDPELATMLDRIVIAGGAVDGGGDVTAAAEFNIYADPSAAQAVFRSPARKLLIPLDVTNQVSFSVEMLDQLPSPATRAGAFLRQIVPFIFRSFHQTLGRELIQLHDAVAMAVLLQETLIESEELCGDVEIEGQLTRGVTVFDRRANTDARPNMEVARSIDAEATIEFVRSRLLNSGHAT